MLVLANGPEKKNRNYFLSIFRTPEQCPSVVSLLSESYNPHVRFGAAMALGIACAGTGLKVSDQGLVSYTN